MSEKLHHGKKIVLLAHYCGDLDGRYSNRFVYLASVLSKSADVELITSNFYHTKKQHKAITGNYPFKITLIDEVGYRKNIGLGRVISHWLFGKKVNSYLATLTAVDLIYISFPSISLAEVGVDFGKKKAIPIVIDVQDLWPETFKPYLRSFLTKFIYSALKKRVLNIYTQANKIVTVSSTFIEHIEKEIGKCHHHVTYIGALWDTPTEGLDSKFMSDEIKVVYLGSLGASYDLEAAIKAFAKAKKRWDFKTNISFTIIGDGPKMESLKRLVDELGVSVSFLGLISHKEVQELLPEFHIALNPIVSWSVASIINKHADYAMAGLPVINSQNNSEYKQLLADYQCGINIEPGDIEGMTKAILVLSSDNDRLKSMSDGAHLLGSEKFNRAITYPKLANKILELV